MISVPVIIMAAVFSPVVTVTVIMAVADNLLVMATAVPGISSLDILMVFPWIVPVYHNFITMVPVEVAVPRWQTSVVHPLVIFIINVLMGRNIIISIYIRQIVIFGMWMANRAPFGLAANVYTYVKTYLGARCFERQATCK